MKGRRQVQRSYSPEEKAEALRRLALNEGNILRTAREISVPTATLYHWKDEQLRESMTPWAKEIQKLIKNAWKNIFTLNNPTFIKKLRAQLLEKGNLKEIAQYTSIMLDKIMALKRVQLLTGGSKSSKEKPLEELTDEELNRLYREEEAKEKKKKESI